MKSQDSKKSGVFCKVPLYGQETNYTCGSASGSMILKSLGYCVSEKRFWKYADADGQGTHVYRVKDTLNHFIGSEKYAYNQLESWTDDDFYQSIIHSIEQGYPVEINITLSSGTEFGYSTDGHYVTITGIYQNENGEYIATINDSFSEKWVSNGQKGQQIEVSLQHLRQYNCQGTGYIIYHK